MASLAEYLRFYYNELRAAVKFYAVGQSEVYDDHLGRAKPSLVSAEALATRMGAPECARAPVPPSTRSDTRASVPAYVPSNSGFRFSTNASTPSRKSCVCWRRP